MNRLITQLIWLSALVCVGMLASSILAWHLLCIDSSIAMQKLAQILVTLSTFLLPALLMPVFTKSRPDFPFERVKCAWPFWLVAAVVMIVAIPAANFLKWQNDMLSLPTAWHDIELWLQYKEQQAEIISQRFLAVDGIGGLTFNLVVMALVPAVSEEFFFRGVLQTIFCRHMNAHVAVWTTAFVFSAVHMQFYGFVPRLFLGAVLGYLFLYSGTIWVSTLAHFVNNALAVVVAYMMQKNAVFSHFETFGTEQTWYAGIISLCLVVALLKCASKCATK